MVALAASCSKPATADRKVRFYQSPMHPWITSDKPGDCTICGMKLVPVYEGESGVPMEEGTVKLGEHSVNVCLLYTSPSPRDS